MPRLHSAIAGESLDVQLQTRLELVQFAIMQRRWQVGRHLAYMLCTHPNLHTHLHSRMHKVTTTTAINAITKQNNRPRQDAGMEAQRVADIARADQLHYRHAEALILQASIVQQSSPQSVALSLMLVLRALSVCDRFQYKSLRVPCLVLLAKIHILSGCVTT